MLSKGSILQEKMLSENQACLMFEHDKKIIKIIRAKSYQRITQVYHSITLFIMIVKEANIENVTQDTLHDTLHERPT